MRHGQEIINCIHNYYHFFFYCIIIQQFSSVDAFYKDLNCLSSCDRCSNLIFTVFYVLFFPRSEYNAFWRCVQAGATYLFVQLCKVSEAFAPHKDLSNVCGSKRERHEVFCNCVISLSDAVSCHIFPHLGGRSWHV